MTPATPREVRRVLVALDPAAQCRAALDMAARLAAASDAELVGLFVEERDLLEAAALPVTRLIRNSDFVPDTLDPTKMAQGLRAWAAQARTVLDSVATRWHVQASFRTTRGSVVEALLSEAGSYDLIALGTVSRASQRRRLGATARAMAREAPCSVLLMRGAQLPGQSVVVLYEGAERALTQGENLARLNACPLQILVASESLAEAVRAWLAGRPYHASLEVLSDCSVAALIDRLSRSNVGIVLLERKGELGSRLDAEQLLAGPASSVVLIG